METMADASKIEVSTKSDNYCQAGDSFCNNNDKNNNWTKPSFLDPSMIDFENQMKDSLMGKVMESFEKTMMEQTKKIENMRLYAEREERQRMRDKNSEHIPNNIKTENIDISNLWRKVHKMILTGDEKTKHDKDRKINIKVINPEMYQIMLSHGLSSWMATLNKEHHQVLIDKIYSDTSQWIAKVWRFRCTASLFHNKLYDGLLKVCLIALCQRYPKYVVDGYNALYSRPPVIYLNKSSDPNLINYLRINLGLPAPCISLVPNTYALKGDEAMDILALSQMIKTDMINGKIPLVIQAFAGFPNTGSIDNLTDIYNLSLSNKIWLHIEGMKLSQLALLQVPSQITGITSKVKSLTLDIGTWLGIPSVPYVTMIMTDIDELYLKTLGIGKGFSFCNSTSMNLFPLWMGLQLIGYDGILKKLQHKFEMSNYLMKVLKDVTHLKIVNSGSKKKSSAASAAAASSSSSTTTNNNSNSPSKEISLKNLMDSVISFLIEGHKVNLVALFKYKPNEMIDEVGSTTNTDEFTDSTSDDNPIIKKPNFVSEEKMERNDIYLNSLNQWLGDTLKSSYPLFDIGLINFPSEGICLRVCIHENINSDNINENDINSFVASLTTHLEIMDATVNQRKRFYELAIQYDAFIYNELPSWAGLGSIIYLPEKCRQSVFALFPDRKVDIENVDFLQYVVDNQEIINSINRNLVSELRSQDEAFSLGRYDIDIRMEHANPEVSATPVPDGLENDNEANSENEVDDDNEDKDSNKMDNQFTDETLSLFCVRFGLVTFATGIENLIELVLEKGTYVERQVKDFDKYTELIKVGIDKVTKELEEEHENRIKEEGLLRQVPYLDSLMNWFSPVNKKSVVGRSLNLSSGEIQMTENTYKYKMQLQTGSKSIFSIGEDTKAEMMSTAPTTTTPNTNTSVNGPEPSNVTVLST